MRVTDREDELMADVQDQRNEVETCPGASGEEVAEGESVRVRIRYEKRGSSCFVLHVSLASLFTRSALRAGLSLTMTRGYSPHPKMSFGPELPAGVVALCEPVDIYLEEVPEDLLERWNAAMPSDFRLLSLEFPPEGSPSLGKVCQAARYWVRCVGGLSCDDILERARAFYGAALLEALGGLDIEEDGSANWSSLVLSAPAQNGIGAWVRRMIADGDIAGWQDLHIVRASIGTMDEVCGGQAADSIR